MNLGQLKYAKGSIKRRRRLGVGTGSGRGGTCGRGTKGQKSRSGGGAHPWFEGGQMPLQRRLPKRGFRKRNPLVYQVVNLKDLERVDPGSVVDAAALAEKGLIRDPEKPVKVLGDGEVQGAYAVKVTAASRSAVQKIEAAGGSVEVFAPAVRSAGKVKSKAESGVEAEKKKAAAQASKGAGRAGKVSPVSGTEASVSSKPAETGASQAADAQEKPAERSPVEGKSVGADSAEDKPAKGNPEQEGQG